jgi:hypothetical protein
MHPFGDSIYAPGRAAMRPCQSRIAIGYLMRPIGGANAPAGRRGLMGALAGALLSLRRRCEGDLRA